MSDATQQAILEQLAISGTIWGRAINEALCRAFLGVLRHLTATEVSEAFSRCYSEERFFPSPAVVLGKLNGPSTEAVASLAWSRLCIAAEKVGRYATVQIDDPPAGEALRLVGGMSVLASMSQDQEPFLRLRFLDAYADAVRRDVSESVTFGGLHDEPVRRIALNLPKLPALGRGQDRLLLGVDG